MVMATTMESALLTPNPLRLPLLMPMPMPSTATTGTVLDTTTAMVWDIMDTAPMDMATTMESALLTPNPLRLPLLLLMPTPSTATTDTVWLTTATDTVWPTTDTDTVWPTMVTMDTLMPTTATTARGPLMLSLPLMPMPSTATTGMLTTDTDTD